MKSEVLAKIDGREITEKDLQEAIMRLPEKNRAGFNTAAGRSQMLNRLTSFELIYSYGRDKGLQETDSYKERLKAAQKDLLIQEASEEIMNSVYLTDTELDDFYERNKGAFDGPDQIEADHILTDSLEKAKEVRELINKGMSFEEAAESFSSCPTAAKGGSLGSFGRGTMVKEFEEAAFALEVGQISEPVRTPYGYHIIRLESRRESSPESIKKNIAKLLLEEKKSQYLDHFIEKLKERYPVEILGS